MEAILDYGFLLLSSASTHALKYFFIAGFAFLIFYKCFPNFFKRNKIQKRNAKQKDVVREIVHSLQTVLCISGVALVILNTPLWFYTKVYFDSDEYPIWWFPLSVLVSLVIHDTYFYWMHRMVHHPKIYKYVHITHHKSINPTPWASYSFNLLEGILEAMITPILVFLIPIHPLALLTFSFMSLAINVYGHLGYEILPKGARYSVVFKIFNTGVHHNLHHSKFTYNYGLYFRFWDKIMGTEYPSYEKEYDKVQSQRFLN